jgi:hypothetical protein
MFIQNKLSTKWSETDNYLFLNHILWIFSLITIIFNEENKFMYTLVVHRSSETSTNQSDVIIRSDDRFLYLVVDSDSIVSKIYRLQFILCFFPSYWQTFCSFIPDVFFLILWQTSYSFVPAYFWHSVNTHIWTSLFFIYSPE